MARGPHLSSRERRIASHAGPAKGLPLRVNVHAGTQAKRPAFLAEPSYLLVGCLRRVRVPSLYFGPVHPVGRVSPFAVRIQDERIDTHDLLLVTPIPCTPRATGGSPPPL